MNKKGIYEQKNKIFEFDNDLVKEFAKKQGFANPFDVTKIDSKEKLPALLLKNDYVIIHKGAGKHVFVKGVNKLYHNFEPLDKIIKWEYRKSLLNQFNTSESNLLSVANNQRILHHFLFGKDTELDDVDVLKRPKTYFPHRTKTNLEYNFGGDKLYLENIQIEIDLTIEFRGHVGVFEGKNGSPTSFNVYQLYHPYLYYHNANKNQLKKQIKKLSAVYVVREVVDGVHFIKLWQYVFKKPKDITSIQFVKGAIYELQNVVQ